MCYPEKLSCDHDESLVCKSGRLRVIRNHNNENNILFVNKIINLLEGSIRNLVKQVWKLENNVIDGKKFTQSGCWSSCRNCRRRAPLIFYVVLDNRIYPVLSLLLKKMFIEILLILIENIVWLKCQGWNIVSNTKSSSKNVFVHIKDNNY